MEFREQFTPAPSTGNEPAGHRFTMVATAAPGSVTVIDLATLMPASPPPGIPALLLKNNGFMPASLAWWHTSAGKPRSFQPNLQLHPDQTHVVRVRAGVDQLLLMGNGSTVSVGIIPGTITRVVDMGPAMDPPAVPTSAAA